MAEWIAALMSPEIAIFFGGLTIAISAGLKFWKPVRKFFKSIEAFLTSWNGTPEVKDWSGTVVETAVPGVMAQIEVLRDQLQNSHQDAAIPNLRDDLDTKASKEDVAKVAALVESVVAKLDQHIEISKTKDDDQDETAKHLKQHVEETSKWTGMLTDMHTTWSKNQRLPPDETNL